MHSTVLFQYLKILNKKELIELHQYLKSPMSDATENVYKLYECIVGADKMLPTKQSLKIELITKEQIWDFIFTTKKAYNDLVLRQMMTALTNAIRSFLVYKELKDSDLGEVLLVKSLQKRGAEKLLEKEINNSLSLLEKQPFRHSDYHFQKFQIIKEESTRLHRRERMGDLKLQEINNELTEFFMIETLKQATSMLSHQNLSKRQYIQPFLNAVLLHIESNFQTTTPSVSDSLLAYFYAYKCVVDNAEAQNFQNLKEIITLKGRTFPLTELRDLYIFAINFCIKKLNGGEESYNFEALELYKNGLKLAVFIENNQLSPFTYNNILRLAIKTKDWAWAEEFLYFNKAFLPTRERENYFNYNLALFHFRKKDYSKAMLLLQEVSLKEVLYNLDARQMLMRIYFEIGEWSALDSLLESFKAYLHRQKGMSYHYESYSNLIKFVQKLLKVDLKNKKQIQKLKDEIEQTKMLFEKAWLLEQLG